ncbi:squalene/phytoene synthase family protein [Paraburkholderia sp. NMBU_R16]|uniref:phytoene/squalene synthase family protein n=1 Tax=Paraburkholderia sp. NMBU_R16 TaxID=2698676 RepID=UPI001564CD27|nr:phytoene/squalene synthase family protein [Paraburkholderia sp. NMBU_R16]NRO98152.1 squalene/phytoene synthase family protein [Paraburkholderia sp. NMBU_R16]
MSESVRAFLLGPLLKSVSRSFYLTLRILPTGVRDPVALAYLLARAADTIADTSLIAPAQRLELLLALRARVNGAPDDGSLVRRLGDEVAAQQGQADEKLLLESLGGAFDVLAQLDPADRDAVREIVTTLTMGMEFDLRTFPDERSGELGSLATFDDLDRYTYLVAGCVGEFWTKMTYAHLPGTLEEAAGTMIGRGIRFGKALQMTNVLRDCGKDLRIGRCYLPQRMLERFALAPQALLEAGASLRARPLMFELVGKTLALYRDALAYTFAIPARSIRLRLACIWPIMIGLETLLLLVENDRWLDPACVSKVPRSRVYGIIARSLVTVVSTRALNAWAEGIIGRIEARIAGHAGVQARTA